jgi:hypothetical protein
LCISILCIEKILKTYNLAIKSITRIVTDNGSNIIKALKVFNKIEYQNSINSMEKVIDEVHLQNYSKFQKIN